MGLFQDISVMGVNRMRAQEYFFCDFFTTQDGFFRPDDITFTCRVKFIDSQHFLA